MIISVLSLISVVLEKIGDVIFKHMIMDFISELCRSITIETQHITNENGFWLKKTCSIEGRINRDKIVRNAAFKTSSRFVTSMTLGQNIPIA